MHLKLILLGCKCKVVRQLSDQIMNKSEFYADLNRDFQALMAGETSFLAMISNTSALLFERLTDVNWAGFYLLEAGLRADSGRTRRMRDCRRAESRAAGRGCSRV